MGDAGPPAEDSLASLGEWRLIERLGRFAPPGQFADDAALLTSSGTLVINTDVLVEGLHFSEQTTEPVHVGWRAAAANLSDLAAMGCAGSIGLTVGLVAPATTSWGWVEGVYRGLQACLQAHGGVLLGGDCSSGPQRILAVTALGCPHAAAGAETGPAVIRRRDGRPGDWLISSGPHGLSRLGLALLRAELPAALSASLPASLRQRAIASHREPQPRFDGVLALHASRPAGAPWRVAGTDSSDGLAAAVRAIATASGCQAQLERQALPLDPAMATLPEAERWCLAGGEDFELVLALEATWAERLLALLPGCRRIGHLVAGVDLGAVTWAESGQPLPQDSSGFCHFQS